MAPVLAENLNELSLPAVTTAVMPNRATLIIKPFQIQINYTLAGQCQDTVAWRQWHHWNKTDSLTSIKLKKGIHKLTLHIVDHGQMNFDHLEFSNKSLLRIKV
jgi:hypothetical protein